MTEKFACSCLNAKTAMEQLINFCRVIPKIPDSLAKNITPRPKDSLGINPGMERKELIAQIAQIHSRRQEADLVFYAYRDLNRSEPEPFLLAAMERSPVSPADAKKLKDHEIPAEIEKMPDKSIYDEDARLAQPDEVWNFKRGDGLEKAVLLANILHQRRPVEKITIDIFPTEATPNIGRQKFRFQTGKKIRPQKWDLSDFAVLV